MHDFEYDVLQKKRLARNAQYRKGKRGGKTCRMTTDHLTEKQWRELNGVVMSYNLNRPMAWADFKAAPIHIQTDYLQYLISTYKVNASSLSQMFGVTPATVRNLIATNQIPVSFRVGCSMTAQEREVWESFINNENEDLPATEPAGEARTHMKKFSLFFSGKIDAAMIANSILGIAGSDSIGNVEIVCSFGENALE